MILSSDHQHSAKDTKAIDESLADLIDDADFQRIVEQRNSFNLFEAVGAVRGELRHSNFLEFLLSPARNHGLGQRPLVRVLRSIIEKMPRNARPITALELMVGDLDGATVDRELYNIDLLIEVRQLNLLVVIENKIDATAGKGQLARYRAEVEKRFPSHKRILVFLTPAGTRPDEPSYIPFSYSELATALDPEGFDHVSSETTLIIKHYVKMLRRHIVPDETLRDLARRLYERYKEAFDFINECKPKQQNMMGIIRSVFDDNSEGLTKDSETSSILRFVPDEWMAVDDLNICSLTDWTKTGRSLLFEIKTYTQEKYQARVNLSLIVGPSDASKRARLYEAAKSRSDLFVGLVKPMGLKWAAIYSRDLLTARNGEALDLAEREAAVGAAWDSFVGSDLPKLRDAILDILETPCGVSKSCDDRIERGGECP